MILKIKNYLVLKSRKCHSKVLRKKSEVDEKSYPVKAYKYLLNSSHLIYKLVIQ